MKTRPVTPARIVFDEEGGPPRSPDFGDVYHARVGALAQARHVFLQGNGLPARWRGRRHFTVLETGFGLGNNFLATWDAWRGDPARCERLCYAAVELHPPAPSDLRRAHAASPLADLAAQLQRAWPEPTPDLHVIDLEGGRLQLLLAFGDASEWLRALRLGADAIYLDGFAPARNPAMWTQAVLDAVGRRAAPGATLATWSVAGALRAGLVTAGFEVERAAGIGGKREVTRARFAPRFTPRRAPASAQPSATAQRNAVVVGAGIAGASVAAALARLGVAVTVIDSGPQPASEASGNPAGLFHGTVHGDDGAHARLFRAAALQAQRDHANLLESSPGIGSAAGLLRLDTRAIEPMRALLARSGLPPGHGQALDTGEASAQAGVALPSPAWFYPGGGWLAPGAAVRRLLQQPGIDYLANCTVSALERSDGGWRLRDAAGAVVAQAGIVVLANASGAVPLLAPLGLPPWPLAHTQGQVSWWDGPAAGAPGRDLRLPVAGDGYAIALPGGGLLCGATRIAGDPATDAALVTAQGHAENLARLSRLTGLPVPGGAPHGRAGWRTTAADRLPIAGMLPCADLPAPAWRLPARRLPREPGLFVLTALGSRGLTLAPLLGRLVAAQATGTPWPLPQDLADAVDPARWALRAARRDEAKAGRRD